jgi:hypothetical protein
MPDRLERVSHLKVTSLLEGRAIRKDITPEEHKDPRGHPAPRAERPERVAPLERVDIKIQGPDCGKGLEKNHRPTYNQFNFSELFLLKFTTQRNSFRFVLIMLFNCVFYFYILYITYLT